MEDIIVVNVVDNHNSIVGTFAGRDRDGIETVMTLWFESIAGGDDEDNAYTVALRMTEFRSKVVNADGQIENREFEIGDYCYDVAIVHLY